MITNCPVCGKEVDTIRARAVSVRGDGKVVAFCSQDCKAQWAETSKPVKAIVDDERSAPVIEITHEPASGVVTSAPDRRDASSGPSSTGSSATGSTTIPEGHGGGTTDASGKASKTVVTAGGGGAGSSTDGSSKDVGSSKDAKDVGSSKDAKDAKGGKGGKSSTDDAKAAAAAAGSRGGGKAAKGSDGKSGSGGATGSGAAGGSATGGKANDAGPGGGKAAKGSDGKPADDAKSGSGRSGKSGSADDAKAAGGSGTAGGKGGKGGKSGTSDDGGSGSDSTEAKKAPPKAFDGKTSDTPMAGFRIDEFQDYEKSDPSRAKPGGNTGLKVGLVLALLGGGAFLAYKFVVSKRGSTTPMESLDATVGAGGGSAVTPPLAPDAPAAPPKPDKAAIYNTTLELLRAQLASGTDRVKQHAATALARAQDPAAVAHLALLLADGRRSETDRIETAYALAGAGDKRGRDLLIAKATGGNREDKHLSAVRLAQLGEKKGFETLANSMQYPQYRVQAAALLARNNDPAGIKQLDDIIASTQTSADDKTTATIYLAIARPAIVPKLHELLSDNRWNKDAARMLARLKDAAAAPVLVQQLELSGLRLGSAHALRLLAGDHSAVVAKLQASLEGAKDTEQIAIAHAVLLLVGPPELGEYEPE